MYKQSINFLPKKSEEENIEEFKLSNATIYSAILPLLASVIWVIAMLINVLYKADLDNLKAETEKREKRKESLSFVIEKNNELAQKVNALKEIVRKDFFPEAFFSIVKSTIRSTGDAEADVLAYKRSSDGKFTIRGKAKSYIDLAKIINAFYYSKSFSSVEIKSIFFDKEAQNVNFEISFFYYDKSDSSQS